MLRKRHLGANSNWLQTPVTFTKNEEPAFNSFCVISLTWGRSGGANDPVVSQIFGHIHGWCEKVRTQSYKGRNEWSCDVSACYSHHCAGGDLDPSAGSCQRGPGGLGSSRSYGERSLSWFCVGGRGGGKLCKVFQHPGQRQRTSQGRAVSESLLLPALPPHQLHSSENSRWPKHPATLDPTFVSDEDAFHASCH